MGLVGVERSGYEVLVRRRDHGKVGLVSKVTKSWGRILESYRGASAAKHER